MMNLVGGSAGRPTEISYMKMNRVSVNLPEFDGNVYVRSVQTNPSTVIFLLFQTISALRHSLSPSLESTP